MNEEYQSAFGSVWTYKPLARTRMVGGRCEREYLKTCHSPLKAGELRAEHVWRHIDERTLDPLDFDRLKAAE